MVTSVVSNEAIQVMNRQSVPHGAERSPGSEENIVTGAARSFRDALARVERSERFVDHAVRRVSRGDELSSGELLTLQAHVYRASQQAELVSRAVDRVSDTVREITQLRV